MDEEERGGNGKFGLGNKRDVVAVTGSLSLLLWLILRPLAISFNPNRRRRNNEIPSLQFERGNKSVESTMTTLFLQHLEARREARPKISRLCRLKYLRSTFLNYVEFLDLWIFRPEYSVMFA